MIVLIIFLSMILIFYMSLFLGKYLTPKIQYVKRIGESIYHKKIKQYNSSAFKPLRRAIEEKSMAQGMGFIAPMIILKSVAFYFISMLLITPLLIFFQGLAMGSMFVYHEKQIGSIKELSIITFWQLFSHLIAGAYGFTKGLDWLYNTNLIEELNQKLFFGFEVFILASLSTAIIASILEVRSLMNSK
jgi:hypothetical protein